MYIIGLLFYVVIPFLSYYVKSVQDFVLSCFQLSPEITVLIGFSYLYPLSVFFMAVLFKKKKLFDISYFRSQVTLSSTLSVSFGLIGTFIGLSQMVAGIASGMNADGDFSSKMAALLAAIGSALDSMSLAFLTSILGVATSVAILFSSNYLSSFFRDKENTKSSSDSIDTLKADDVFYKNLGDRLDLLREEQHTHQQAIEKTFSEIVTNITSQGEKYNIATDSIKNAMHQVIDVTKSTQLATCKTIDEASKQLSLVASILQDLRVQMAPPLEESLTDAICEETLDLVYQVQTDADETVIGAEVYVYWEDPVRGVIPNYKLFEVANEFNLTEKIDRWILKSAIKQVSLWKKSGIWGEQYVMSINLCNKSIIDPRLINYTETLLGDYGLEAKNFAFEITENTIMSHPEESRDKIRQISRLGIKVYIDDFGTGYSSLVRLRELKIDRLKIDKDIVQNVLEYSDQKESVVRSIMNVAKDLNIEVAAEGIETQEQLKLLSEVGCTMFQGYLLGRPEKANEFQVGLLK